MAAGTAQEKTEMLKRCAMALSLVVLSAPAFASEYWVVQSGEKQCSVVERNPQPGEAQKAPSGAMGPAYQTREQAESVIQRELACGGSSH